MLALPDSSSPPKEISFQSDFETWRAIARDLIASGEKPGNVRFRPTVTGSASHPPAVQQTLFTDPSSSVQQANIPPNLLRQASSNSPGKGLRTTKRFIRQARLSAHHTDPDRYDLLYRLLWRLQFESSWLMANASDPDVRSLETLARQVRRDAHKTKAFVRFKRLEDFSKVAKLEPFDSVRAIGTESGLLRSADWYVAWYRPDHDVLPLVADFFIDRFGSQNFAVLTPHRSLIWDQRSRHFAPGVRASSAMIEDRLDELWRMYYSSIFNPARANPRAMLQEMPSRYWRNLPEARLIPELLRDAGVRTREMRSRSRAAERPLAPVPVEQCLSRLSSALDGCSACGLCENGTRPVSGSGPPDASLMIVGEAPGDMEEVQGRPFVGPAGAILREFLAEAGVEIRDCYVTNAVKHFKFRPDDRGLRVHPTSASVASNSGVESQGEPAVRRRIHEGPSLVEVSACRPWVEAELRTVRPRALLCLGATASRSLIHPDLSLLRSRGIAQERSLAARIVPGLISVSTYHPAYLLRAPEKLQAKLRTEFLADLRLATQIAAP